MPLLGDFSFEIRGRKTICLCQQSEINVGLTMGMSSGTSLRTVLGSSAFVLGVLTPHWMMFVDQAESW